jgi:DNA-binding HxlR family transcriptional regulator
MHLAELSNKTALSKRQIIRLLKELEEWGLITKHTDKQRKGSSWESEMKLSVGGKIKQTVKDIKTTHKRPGGNQRCHNCGSKNIEAVVYKCLDCGHHGPFDED